MRGQFFSNICKIGCRRTESELQIFYNVWLKYHLEYYNNIIKKIYYKRHQ